MMMKMIMLIDDVDEDDDDDNYDDVDCWLMMMMMMKMMMLIDDDDELIDDDDELIDDDEDDDDDDVDWWWCWLMMMMIDDEYLEGLLELILMPNLIKFRSKAESNFFGNLSIQFKVSSNSLWSNFEITWYGWFHVNTTLNQKFHNIFLVVQVVNQCPRRKRSTSFIHQILIKSPLLSTKNHARSQLFCSYLVM